MAQLGSLADESRYDAEDDPWAQAALAMQRRYASRNIAGGPGSAPVPPPEGAAGAGEGAMGGLARIDNDPGDTLIPPPPSQMGSFREGFAKAFGKSPFVGGTRTATPGILTEEDQFRANQQRQALTDYGAKGAVGATLDPVPAGLALAAGQPLRTVTSFGAGAGQDLWHPISSVKLPKPLSEYTSTHVPRATLRDTPISPADLQGKMLLPTIADTTRPDTFLTHIGGYRLPDRVPMQGGARFPAVAENSPAVWMADQGMMTSLLNRQQDIAKQFGKDVVVMPTALSPGGADYSHHVWRPLVDLVKDAKGISKSSREQFNAAMRDVDPAFPGLGSTRARLINYFDAAPRAPRVAFAQNMDTRWAQSAGFPDVASVRKAVIDPDLLNAPLGSSGFSAFKLDPKVGVVPKDIHGTYSHAGLGENVGTLGGIVPPGVMFPDVMGSLGAMAAESGKSVSKYTGRPDYYFQGRIPVQTKSGVPLMRAQLANQEWVDSVSDYLRRYNKVGGAAALGAGMTLAEIAAAQEQPAMGGLAAQDRYE